MLLLGIVCMRCAEWSPQILPSEDDIDDYPSRKTDWSSILSLSNNGWKTCEVSGQHEFAIDDGEMWSVRIDCGPSPVSAQLPAG